MQNEGIHLQYESGKAQQFPRKNTFTDITNEDSYKEIGKEGKGNTGWHSY